MNLYTIGFAGKPAERFFGLLRDNGVQRLIDTRRHPKGQLAGFAKQDDLAYFLSALVGCSYQHLPLLAPDEDMLAQYRHDKDWPAYVHRFEALLDERRVPDVLDRQLFAAQPCCLLCSEHRPDKCHRRLVAERLSAAWPGTTVIHLM